MPEPSVQKARIVNESNTSQAVVCHFNPNDLSLTRSIKWDGKINIGEDASKLTFAGGEAQDLTIPLLFDLRLPMTLLSRKLPPRTDIRYWTQYYPTPSLYVLL